MKKLVFLLIGMVMSLMSSGQIRVRWVESFERDGNGNGLRYECSYDRILASQSPLTVSNTHGIYVYNTAANTFMTSRGYDMTTHDSITIDISVAANPSGYLGWVYGTKKQGIDYNNLITRNDYLDLEFSTNGTTWTTLFKFRPEANNTNSGIFYDINNNERRSNNEPYLTNTFTKFTKNVPTGTIGNTANTIYFRIIGLTQNTPIAFDYIRILGRKVTTPTANYTRLLYQHCGENIRNLNYTIYAVDSSTYDWDWEINNQVVRTTGHNLQLFNNFPSLQYNTDYSVNIRAVNTLDNTLGPWIDNNCILRIGTPIAPNNNTCNLTLTSTKLSIWCTNIGGATQYKIKVNGNEHIINQNNVRLYNLGYKTAGAYQIQWSAFAGGNWTDWGNSCTINVTNTVLRIANNIDDNTTNSILIEDKLYIEDISKTEYKIIDITGKEIKHTRIGDELDIPEGVYFLITENERIKLIK